MSAVARSNRPAPKLLPEFVGAFTFVFIDAGAAAVVRDDVGSAGIAALALAHGLVMMAFAVAFRERAGNFSRGAAILVPSRKAPPPGPLNRDRPSWGDA
jgi:hypothetical protein